MLKPGDPPICGGRNHGDREGLAGQLVPRNSREEVNNQRVRGTVPREDEDPGDGRSLVVAGVSYESPGEGFGRPDCDG